MRKVGRHGLAVFVVFKKVMSAYKVVIRGTDIPKDH
jgi:hypothetical protein